MNVTLLGVGMTAGLKAVVKYQTCRQYLVGRKNVTVTEMKMSEYLL